jgi:hypothetical protein
MTGSFDVLEKLCKGVRAIAPGVEVRIKTSEVIHDHVSIMVVAGAAVLIFTDFAPLEESLAQACHKLASISSKMMAAVRPTDPAPFNLETDPDSESGKFGKIDE